MTTLVADRASVVEAAEHYWPSRQDAALLTAAA